MMTLELLHLYIAQSIPQDNKNNMTESQIWGVFFFFLLPLYNHHSMLLVSGKLPEI